MTGRGRSRGVKSQETQRGRPRTGGGRGYVQQTPVQSAWGNPNLQRGNVQPTPVQSAWGNPNSQPGNNQPTPVQSAWGNPNQLSSTTGAPAGRSRQPEPPRQQQQNKPQQAPALQRGGNVEVDRGARRGKNIITDIIRTKPENLQTKRGTSGTVVTLQTNYFRLLKKPTWQIYQYRVDFSPNIEIQGLHKRLIYEQKATFGGYIFDGSMMFLTVKLPQEITEFMSKDREGNPIQTTVKFVGLVSMENATSVQILNLILRRSMDALKLQLVGRNFFDAVAKIDIPQHQLQLWPGYMTSIRQHEVDILLCAEVTNKVMRTETVYDILQDTYNKERDYKSAFQNIVLGMTVLTAYNNKTYRIDDVDFEKSPKSTFPTKDGNSMSFLDYYKTKYNINIRDQNQPLLVSKASARDIRAGLSETISLVPELCRATGLNERMRNDFVLMSAVALYTRLNPRPRIEKLQAFNRRLQQTKESVENFKEWNFSLDKELVVVTGRQLVGEQILFGNKRCPTNADADWSRDFRNVTMYTSQHLKNWIIIVPTQKARKIQDFLGILTRAAQGMKYEIGKPTIIEIPDDRVQAYAGALEQACSQNPQLIMVIVLNNNSDKYSLIKKKCCVERAIPTQVMVVKTITPKPGKDINSLMTVGTKVVIQMNSKLGGAPRMVDIPLSGLMVIGFDVCHDTKDKSKSYGALVATMDMKQCQNYFSAVSPHTNGEELCNQFTLNTVKALQTYQRQHKCLPARILIYRDGVGEGQTNYVFEHEIQNLRRKLDDLYNGPNYKMAFIVVSKRINTRFFKGDLNPSPGTVVDDVVTLPERYDFFLVSQCVKQGTVSPTNYNILYDSFGMPPDKLQVFTYKMTHLYYNWTGTLRVPAVCQYAHKLAFLVGNFIHQSPSSILEKQLYFL